MPNPEVSPRARQIDIFLSTIDYLPPAPQILLKLLPLLANPDTECNHIVELIRFDASLTAKILQTSNSAALAPSQRTSDLFAAVTSLGFREVYRLVAVVTGLSVLRVGRNTYGINGQYFWRHSATTAIASQLLAAECGEDENVAFTAGLLHDLGKIILAQKFMEEYSRVVAQAFNEQRPVHDLEQELLGMQHSEVGGRLLALWNFSDNVISAVTFHHQPEIAIPPYQRLGAIVCVSDRIAHILENEEAGARNPLPSCEEGFALLQISENDLPNILERTKRVLPRLAHLYPAQ